MPVHSAPREPGPQAAAFARERRALALEARLGFPARGGGAKAIAARAALARLLWSAAGERRVPPLPALDRALSALPLGELPWLVEFGPLGPLYLFPTRPFLRALARQIRALGAHRVLEVAAGDGHLSRALAREAPDLEVLASDSGAWERPQARMSASERRALASERVAGLPPGEGVHRLEARAGVRALRPDLVLACWLPPGPLLARIIRAPVRHVLEIGAGSGVTGDVLCWRFAHEFIEGPLEALARCRLDERPARATHTRITLYPGRAHPDFHEERVGPSHFLWAMRPSAGLRPGGRRP
jgi:hypothetical protein